MSRIPHQQSRKSPVLNVFIIGMILCFLACRQESKTSPHLKLRGDESESGAVETASSESAASAGEAIRALAPGSYSLSRLIVRASQGNSSDRRNALFQISEMGAAAEEAAPTLLRWLNDPDPLIRLSTIDALRYVAPRRRDVIKALASLLSDSDERIVTSALVALAEGGGAASFALEEINSLRNAPSPLTRVHAEYASLSIGSDLPGSEVDCSGLLSFFGHRSASIREKAIQFSGYLAPHSKEAIPYLISALDDKDVSVGAEAARALGRFGALAKEALPRIEALQKRLEEASRNGENSNLYYLDKYSRLFIVEAIFSIQSATSNTTCNNN